MEESFAIVAVLAGLGTVLVSIATVLMTLVQVRTLKKSTSHHTLEVRVDGNKFVIDVGSIDREDPKNIEAAIRAVKKTASIAA
jgi:hypothetical protein